MTTIDPHIVLTVSPFLRIAILYEEMRLEVLLNLLGPVCERPFNLLALHPRMRIMALFVEFVKLEEAGKAQTHNFNWAAILKRKKGLRGCRGGNKFNQVTMLHSLSWLG